MKTKLLLVVCLLVWPLVASAQTVPDGALTEKAVACPNCGGVAAGLGANCAGESRFGTPVRNSLARGHARRLDRRHRRAIRRQHRVVSRRASRCGG